MSKVLYIGFWESHSFITCPIYNLVFNNDDYIVSENKININKNELEESDIIMCGSFLHNSNDVELVMNYKNKLIYYITEPIEFNNRLMYNRYINGDINLAIGCVPNNDKNIKYPIYLDEEYINRKKIEEINEYVKTISLTELLEKNFACLINKHDMGGTRTPIYNELCKLGNVICPSNLYNNFDNATFESIGRIPFQNRFIFSICTENFITTLDGYVTEKLLFACMSGNIPIYYGKLDCIDTQIFNIDRILVVDPTDEKSIGNLVNKIKELISDSHKLYNYYTKDIFVDTALETINMLKTNLINKITNFIPKIISYDKLSNILPDIRSSNKSSNIVIAMNTSFEILKSEGFKIFIDKLINSVFPPKYICVKVGIEDDIESYNIINNDYPSLIISCYKSKTPYENIENLLLLKDKIDENDRIIFIKDNFNPSPIFTYLYELCYQLYLVDGVVAASISNNILFWDNYYGELDISASYSFKYKYIKERLKDTFC